MAVRANEPLCESTAMEPLGGLLTLSSGTKSVSTLDTVSYIPMQLGPMTLTPPSLAALLSSSSAARPSLPVSENPPLMTMAPLTLPEASFMSLTAAEAGTAKTARSTHSPMEPMSG